MGVDVLFDRLPFSWEGKPLETILSDCRWLESIVRNAAPFSDWWTKARIVQLAYPTPTGTAARQYYGLPVYGGFPSAAAIAEALRQSNDPQRHPDFARLVNEEYVIETLNCWKAKQFTQAIGRNFDIYAHRKFSNVFLVVSTAPVSLQVDRVLPSIDQYRPLFNVNELGRIIRERQVRRLTLRTHGYSNPAKSFYGGFNREAHALHTPDPMTAARTLEDDHLYVGYHWPSEQPITSPGLWRDYRSNPGILLKFLFVLSGIAGIVGTLLYAFLKLIGIPLLRLLGWLPGISQAWRWSNFAATADTAVRWYWIVPTVFMTWLLAFLLLRIVVYQRDRYRAVHYGAPDLAEFFWRLDRAISIFDSQDKQTLSPPDPNEGRPKLLVNLVGHSMGGLVLVNVLRILSDRYAKDEQGTLKPDSELDPQHDPSDSMGKHMRLDYLILASPDIPLEFLREGRNNYVRSAMRRCRRIYLMSSDRDIVLRYLSTVGNWFTEPSMEMAGLRLGNLYLKEMPLGSEVSYRPYIRIMLHSERAVQPTSSYELFRKFNYLDCSEMGGEKGDGGVNAVPLPLNRLTALPIDLLNTLLYFLGVNRLDVHGGYFQPNTRSFKVLQFLLTANFLADEVIKSEIKQLVQDTPIRFLPSQPWVMPQTPQSPRS